MSQSVKRGIAILLLAMGVSTVAQARDAEAYREAVMEMLSWQVGEIKNMLQNPEQFNAQAIAHRAFARVPTVPAPD
jgi:cytochrome c556